MILTVCLNPAIDVTYTPPAFTPGSSVTVESIEKRAGGKGVNTARALHALGEDVVLCGFAGREIGRWLVALLAEDGLRESITPIGNQTRQCVTVFDGEHATVFNERGPSVTEDEWLTLLADVGRELETASAVSFSGSVPPGCPSDAYRQLVELANVCGVPSVLDTSGPQLAMALDARPTITAPNLGELLAILDGSEVDRPLLDAATELAKRTSGAVVVSAGADGLIAVSDGRAWTAAPELWLKGNPTGAGDALTAALVRGLSRNADWPTMLREAVALAGAAVVSPTAGDVDVAAYVAMLGHSIIREI